MRNDPPAPTLGLFDTLPLSRGRDELLAEGAWLLRGFVAGREDAILAGVDAVIREAPPRHLITPGGYRMSVAMTNAGPLGWVSDATGYRYEARDPTRRRPWPAMPAPFLTLAADAAQVAGFARFVPDACLVNRYEPGAKLSLHQDRNEGDLAAPIVSVSLGLPATFLFGGIRRADRPRRVRLEHGDVVVFGGPSRLRYHGVAPIEDGLHPRLGAARVNLTFRRARPTPAPPPTRPSARRADG